MRRERVETNVGGAEGECYIVIAGHLLWIGNNMLHWYAIKYRFTFAPIVFRLSVRVTAVFVLHRYIHQKLQVCQICIRNVGERIKHFQLKSYHSGLCQCVSYPFSSIFSVFIRITPCHFPVILRLVTVLWSRAANIERKETWPSYQTRPRIPGDRS